MKKFLIFVSLFIFSFGCNEYVIPELKDGKDGLNGANAAWEYEVFGPTDDYPAGGVRVLTGLDYYPYDGIMDVQMGPGFVLVNGEDASDVVGVGKIPVFSLVGCDLFADDVNLGNICGADGKNGTVWTINEDGFWVKDGVVTETRAVGENGPQGPQGEPGIPGVVGKTLIPWPLVTEIPANEEHTNGGLMYTWYMLGQDLQITDESQLIGAYPVWHGNDGADGDSFYYNEETNTIWVNNYNTEINVLPEVTVEDCYLVVNGEPISYICGTDGETPQVDVYGCEIFVNGESQGSICGDPGKDGKSPEPREVDGEYYWFYWNGVEWVNTWVTIKGDKGDATSVDFAVQPYNGSVCGDVGGTQITILLDGGSDNGGWEYSFIVCNGPEGIPGTCTVEDCEDGCGEPRGGNDEDECQPDNKGKVTVCHQFSIGSINYYFTKTIDLDALQGHLDHGDTCGECVN